MPTPPEEQGSDNMACLLLLCKFPEIGRQELLGTLEPCVRWKWVFVIHFLQILQYRKQNQCIFINRKTLIFKNVPLIHFLRVNELPFILVTIVVFLLNSALLDPMRSFSKMWWVEDQIVYLLLWRKSWEDLKSWITPSVSWETAGHNYSSSSWHESLGCWSC